MSEVTIYPEALHGFVEESNRIEGICRPPHLAELEAHYDFLRLPSVTVQDLANLVQALQPDAILRNVPGLNVKVGNHIPKPGGRDILLSLDHLLANLPEHTPRANHVVYETLHPFTDGNGRSGRALWLWQHLHIPGGTPKRAMQLGFLHTYYYETLTESQAPDQSKDKGNDALRR